MSWRSLGEAYSLCRSAARGAGMPWGMADECGRAARWLLRNRMPLAPLLALLENRDAVCGPEPDSRPLRGTEEGLDLCPLSAGVWLGDSARILAREGGCDLAEAAHPVLIAPFLPVWGAEVELKWRGARVFMRRGEVLVRSEGDAVLASRAAHAAVRIREEMRIPEGMVLADYPPPEESFWSRMGKLAARTYVPSGEVSRRDAGAGVSDND